jgi:hypothetical protein
MEGSSPSGILVKVVILIILSLPISLRSSIVCKDVAETGQPGGEALESGTHIRRFFRGQLTTASSLRKNICVTPDLARSLIGAHIT